MNGGEINCSVLETCQELEVQKGLDQMTQQVLWGRERDSFYTLTFISLLGLWGGKAGRAPHKLGDSVD